MAADTSPIRRKTRRAKDLALDRAIDVLEHPQDYDKETYNQTFLTVLKNSVPRSQEITGEEGEAIQIAITGMKIIKDPSGGNTVPHEEREAA